MKTPSDLKRGVDYIGVTCVFFCYDGRGRLLMQKRSRHCRDEKGRWDCGSGSVEFGETPEQTVRREVKEEYGVMPKNLKLCGVTTVLRKNGVQRTHWVAFVFSVVVDPEKVKLGDPRKIDKIKWFDQRKLPKLMHSMMRKHLHTVRKAVPNL